MYSFIAISTIVSSYTSRQSGEGVSPAPSFQGHVLQSTENPMTIASEVTVATQTLPPTTDPLTMHRQLTIQQLLAFLVLIQANCIANPNFIQVGQVLRVSFVLPEKGYGS